MLALAAAPALAIQPGHWTNDTEADFDAGTTHDTVVTNLGDVKLASSNKTLAKLGKQATILYDMQRLDGDLYLAAGPEGILLERHGDKTKTIATLEDEQIFALGVYHHHLLVAISGTPSRLAVLEHGKLRTLVKLKDVRYIWDTLVEGDTIIVATGTEGKVLAVDMAKVRAALKAAEAAEAAKAARLAAKRSGAESGDAHSHPAPAATQSAQSSEGGDAKLKSMATEVATPGTQAATAPTPGERGLSAATAPSTQKTKAPTNPGVTTILDTKQSNVLCLGQDAQGHIYAGTDTNGLVYRLTKDGGKYDAYVLYDAPEPEIGSLLVLPDGTVYAGTANAKQARPGRLTQAQSKQTGRPVPQPSAATPGKLPHTPPSPNPVKKSVHSKHIAPGLPGEGAHNPKNESKDPDSNSAKHSASKRTGSKHPTQAKAAAQPATPPSAPDAIHAAKSHATQAEKNADNAKPHAPTAAQYDRLRMVVQRRLDKARTTGVLDVGNVPVSGPEGPGGPGGPSATGPSRVEPVSHEQPTKQGNAIYRIDPQGFVHEIFRESVMILKIVKVGDHLIVGTGNQGQLYSVDPDTQETTILANLEPEQIPAITTDAHGNILLGTANPATLVRLSKRVADRGTYTSEANDASQVSLWGKLNLTATIPADTSVTVETRSGNVGDPDEGGWSKWSQAQVFVHHEDAPSMIPRQMAIQSPPARFLEYRLTLIGHGDDTPVVHSVDMAYVTPNLRPKIAEISAKYPSAGDASQPPSTVMHVKWKASDPNDDDLIYTLEYRHAGSKKWIEVKKDISDTSFAWQTQQVPDGYYELRVTASDSPDNPPDMALSNQRESDPVLVDNQAPRLEHLRHHVKGDSVTIKATAVDDYSTVASVNYVVDSGTTYQPILPDDLIYDSTREAWHVTIPDLSPGPHVVTLRVTDSRGNTAYRAVTFTVK